MKTRQAAANEAVQALTKHTLTTPPVMHFSPQVGWINDPNGFSYYDGQYHLFYQYNPYDIIWNNIHWGHATTSDFINWEHHPIALANDKLYDANGCFSGSAIEKDGKLYLMYTGHQDPNLLHQKDESQIKQVQCVAVSDDGINFTKLEQNPVIAESQLPDDYLICDFRDPKVWEHEGRYYCILAARNKQRRGEILMYVSVDLVEWTFHSAIVKTAYEEHTLLECPDFFRIGDKDVMLYSAMPCDPEYAGQVAHRVCYAIGKLDYETGQFITEHEGLLDYGHSFYAPQATAGKDKERLLLGWMQSWNQAKPPEGFTFNGMMSLPRELTIEQDALVQFPAAHVLTQLSSLCEQQMVQLQADETFELVPLVAGHISLSIDLDNVEKPLHLDLQQSEQQRIRISVDACMRQLSITSDYSNTSETVAIVDTHNQQLQLDLFIDHYSLEVFINKGKQVYTTTSYLEKGTSCAIVAEQNVTLHHLSQSTCSIN